MGIETPSIVSGALGGVEVFREEQSPRHTRVILVGVCSGSFSFANSGAW